MLSPCIIVIGGRMSSLRIYLWRRLRMGCHVTIGAYRSG